MKFPKDQPFWTSVILHVAILLGLFLVTVVQAIRPKEKPHVFEMVASPESVSQDSQPQPSPEVPSFDMPELQAVPEAVKPAPQPPAPKPTPVREAPTPKPKLISADEFFKTHGKPKPRQQPQSQPRQDFKAPQISPPTLVIPSNPSPSRPSPQQLTPQQISALGAYSSALRGRIDAAWAKPSNLAGVKVAATVIFDVSASGRITNARLKRSSGNSAFDQSVLSAFRKVTSAGPTPTGQAHTFEMTFRMTD